MALPIAAAPTTLRHARRGSAAGIAGARKRRHQQPDMVVPRIIADLKIQGYTIEKRRQSLPLIVRPYVERQPVRAGGQRTIEEIAYSAAARRFARAPRTRALRPAEPPDARRAAGPGPRASARR